MKPNKRIDSFLEGAATAVILGHVHPDGDCVGSCLALYHYIRKVSPDCRVRVFLEPFSKEFRLLQGAEEISHDFGEDAVFDLCICMDTADPDRLGGARRYLDTAKRSVCIDHHVTNPGFAQENIICPASSSASEVLYELMDPDRVDLTIAECIYLGLVHDTGVFKYSCTSERTMQIAGALLTLGVDAAQIIDDTFYRKTFVQNLLLGQALLSARLMAGGRMIASVVTMEDMARFGASAGDTDGIIDQLRVTEGVETALLIYETSPGHFKLSLRSNRIVDVSRIAGMYGGGGHVRAAGGRTQEDPWKTAEDIAGLVEEAMDA